MRVGIIVAMATNGVIGRDGDLPWRLPADLRWFRRVTMGHHVIMGRKTWESIGRPLPGRTLVVLTRDPEARRRLEEIPGVVAEAELSGALDRARAAGDTEALVAGGAEVYAHALPLADRLYLTRVHGQVEGDVVFPAFDSDQWTETAREEHAADDRHALPFALCTLERRAPPSPGRAS
ncbi:dihydrofolate reductase [Paraliomyxa miuraensis]|uniref:dihydrofolate reductase n=1 Tax=Paraliomyxa miuraensis TaxID=376150 RepID=UPI002253B857|nr:dihydrofolate reductase [Paraliomyxa miuraensis]MCX4247359.1 dihydrofolate reductase [Paraliomyxa miuraensis]